MVVEAGYRRALQDQPEFRLNKAGEDIWTVDKIRFWRARIPEACGVSEGQRGNMLEAQRELQEAWRRERRAPGFTEGDQNMLFGNLVGWRQDDLQSMSFSAAAWSPTAPLVLCQSPLKLPSR